MTKKIKCIIVDDEPLARNVLVKHAKQIHQLEVVAVCANAVEAFGYLQNKDIDVVFLDIKMPKINGMELLESLDTLPLIVFTTAYREFAIRAFELDAIDYLLKPISLGRFMKTISKINKYLSNSPDINLTDTHHPQETVIETEVKNPDVLYIKSQRKILKLDLKDIKYLESLNDKVIIHTCDSGDISTTQRIGYLAEKLPKKQFLRIHRSFIVAIEKVNAFNSIMVEINAKELPIGRNYRSHALDILRSHSN
ncbi:MULTISPECIES: LytR/AlgR family response regulator transcription factor [Flavobacteriaceae]|uniref:LytR/AlgR family response regulator transcription factor n=1 Tax=Flavobacteriaceae TaxID=49546 RepID=UPI00149093FF|nr:MULTISPECIES: LytTR family DNA-binding domain-containing protein [Allomuricauda]MDC6365953.1 LytTR family DNA-binding domain-containing protein [Muricauda sp. AC10]